MTHECIEHDKKFPKDLISCNPKHCLCTDCPFTFNELMKRFNSKYGVNK
jgi:hypothetical protein